MSMQIDAWIEKLLALVKESSAVQGLEVEKNQARELGEDMSGMGRFSLMKTVAHEVRNQGRSQGQPYVLGYVERWWDGIGQWRS